MIDTSGLPFWARRYVEHIYDHVPDTYDELEESGQLMETALSVEKSAKALYEQLYDQHKAAGSNDTTADIMAESSVMRACICIAPDEEDEESDYPDWDEIYEERKRKGLPH